MKVMRLIMIITMSTTLLYANLAVADGERHPGNHANASGGSCLKPIQKRGSLGVGFWENTCNYGVHVKWRVEGKGAACEFRPESPMPCLTYVPANSRVTAHTSGNDGRGGLFWITCKAKDFVSDPWPVIVKVKPDRRVQYGCYHMGYSPSNKFGNKEEAKKRFVQIGEG